MNATGKDDICWCEHRAFDAIGSFALSRFTAACSFSRKRSRGTTAERWENESAAYPGDWQTRWFLERSSSEPKPNAKCVANFLTKIADGGFAASIRSFNRIRDDRPAKSALKTFDLC